MNMHERVKIKKHQFYKINNFQMVKLGNWKSFSINPQSLKTEFSMRRINLNCKYSENNEIGFM